MSINKAKTLMRSLRWYHIGFAFVWAVMFGGLSISADASGDYGAYRVCQQVCVIAAVLVAMLIERFRMPFPPLCGIAAGLGLGLGALAFHLEFSFGVSLSGFSWVSGMLVGCSAGFFYALWQQFFASEGASRTAIYIPLSAVLSVGLSAIMRVLPDAAQIACAVAVFPVLAAVSLRASLAEIRLPDPPPRMTRALAASTVRDLWKPVFCTCAIGLVWRLVSALFSVPADASSNAGIAGLALAAAVVLLIELVSDRGFEAMRAYQVLFPLVTGAFMLPSLLGVQYAPVVVGMLLFGFEVLNLLLIVTCAVYASERNVPAVHVYALCVGPTLASMFVGDILGTQLNPIIAYDFALGVNVLFVCVYALSLVLFLISFRRSRRSSITLQGESISFDMAVVGASEPLTPAVSSDPEPELFASAQKETPDSSDIGLLLDARIEALGLSEPFSKREREVVSLVLRGNNVPGISRKLYISENTTRDHMKSIYRKAGVHSRQELIDLFD